MLTPAAVSQVRRAVRTALRVEAGEPPLWRWSGQVPEADFVRGVLRHRVAGLVAGADTLALPGDVRARLAAAARLDRMEAMRQVRVLAEVVEAMHDVPHLVLKGAALSVQTTGDLTARGAGDVDILVEVGSLREALDRLRGRGFALRPEHASDPEAWMWRYQLRVAHEVALDGPATPVDVHWRLDPTYDALPDFETLWGRRERLEVGPVGAATLGRADALAHALRHAARDDWGSLRSLVDVHRLARDPGAWSASQRLDRLARTSLTTVEATVGLPTGTPPFRRCSSGLPRAMVAQRRSVRFTRFPGDAALRYAGYCLAGSRTPRDVTNALASLALPPLRVCHVRERDAVRAIARGLLARSRPSSAWAEHR